MLAFERSERCVLTIGTASETSMRLGEAVGQRPRELIDVGLDRVRRRDDIGAAAAKLEGVMPEHRRDRRERDAIEMIE